VNGEQRTLTITPITPNTLSINYLTDTFLLKVKRVDSLLFLDDGEQIRKGYVDVNGNNITLYTDSGSTLVERFNWQQSASGNDATNHQLTSPMPGTIVAILKTKGDTIKKGEALIVIEAMKMEHTILAPNDGIVGDIFYDVGAQVNEGAELVEVRALEEEHP